MLAAATTTTSRYVIIRPFEAQGQLVRTGEVVDTTEWRSRAVDSLTERRYMQPLPFETSEDTLVVCNRDNRVFIDKASLLAHLRLLKAEQAKEQD